MGYSRDRHSGIAPMLGDGCSWGLRNGIAALPPGGAAFIRLERSKETTPAGGG
jgi:hypothetical protein